MGLLSDFMLEKYKHDVRYDPRPLTKTVAIGVTQVWKENADRLGLVLMNIGANSIYVHTEPTVSTTNGLLLAALGGVMVLTAEDDGAWVGYPIYVYSAAGSTIFSAEVSG